MRFVIQRVNHACVRVDGEAVGTIGKGLLVLVGVSPEDNEAVADKMVHKLCGLRIFDDANGKTNLSLADVNGSLLMVSQFTLYADCHKGFRPSFIGAAAPEMANRLYEYVLDACRQKVPVVEKGIFGAHMKIELENDGPFTIVLDSRNLSI